MRYRVEIDRELRAAFAEWEDALRFAKAAAAVDEERTVQVIETGERQELILDNPEAAAFCAEQSIRSAIARGMDPELAESLYRPRGRDSSRRRTGQEDSG